MHQTFKQALIYLQQYWLQEWWHMRQYRLQRWCYMQQIQDSFLIIIVLIPNFQSPCHSKGAHLYLVQAPPAYHPLIRVWPQEVYELNFHLSSFNCLRVSQYQQKTRHQHHVGHVTRCQLYIFHVPNGQQYIQEMMCRQSSISGVILYQVPHPELSPN